MAERTYNLAVCSRCGEQARGPVEGDWSHACECFAYPIVVVEVPLDLAPILAALRSVERRYGG